MILNFDRSFTTLASFLNQELFFLLSPKSSDMAVAKDCPGWGRLGHVLTLACLASTVVGLPTEDLFLVPAVVDVQERSGLNTAAPEAFHDFQLRLDWIDTSNSRMGPTKRVLTSNLALLHLRFIFFLSFAEQSIFKSTQR